MDAGTPVLLPSLMFPNSVPLDAGFYARYSKYNDIRRAKIMMLSDSLSKFTAFSTRVVEQKTELVKLLERGCYSLSRQRGLKKGFDVSWDDENFKNLYHDICYKLVANIDSDSDVGSSYLADMILTGRVLPLEAAAMSSQDMAPDKYVSVLEKVKSMYEEVKIKTSKLYTCPKCKHQETVLSQVQDRSLDENSSLIAVCVYCSYRWRMAG